MFASFPLFPDMLVQFATVNSIWSLLTGFPFVQISSSSGNATTLTSEFNGSLLCVACFCNC